MKYLYYLLPVLTLLFMQCADDSAVNTQKDTFYDDIADICYVSDHFFTTNYDLSGHAGDQIDLIRFDATGTHVDDAFDLSLNGQGFLAMTTDGVDIYLQSRNNGGIIKSSLIGERAYMRWDSLDASHWMASGICYLPQKDSLLLLYRNLNRKKEYRARTVSKTRPHIAGSERLFSLDFIDTTSHGIWAIAYKDTWFYMLGLDTLYEDKLIITDEDFQVITVEDIVDSTVVGLCFKDDDLYFSYRPRRIEQYGSY